MEVDLDLFQMVILPGRDPDPAFFRHYQEAYKCWYNVWSDAYRELGVDKKLFSDDFTRQTEICTVFYQMECVGMLFLSWFDMASPASSQDSYFKVWTESDLTKLTREGQNILVCSNTTIGKTWRKSNCPISMKDLIVYLTCYQRFKNSAADGLTGVTRRARGVHELTYRYGAIPLRENVAHFDETDRVDVVAFYKDTIKEGPYEDVVKLGRRMWEERIEVKRVVTEMPTQLTIVPRKKAA